MKRYKGVSQIGRKCTVCMRQLHATARDQYEVLYELLPLASHICEDLTAVCPEHMEDLDAGDSPRLVVYRDPALAGAA